jgi:hypothetical protein
MQRTKWTDRKFELNIPAGWLPDIVERLTGTKVRLREMVKNLSEVQASFKPHEQWSIKEHIGHLTDLEQLHEGRIDDFINRRKELRAADMSNAKTYEANHNTSKLDELLKDFENKRNTLVKRLQGLDDDTQRFESLHPRLQKPMKPVDMAFFTAEHDDHHLASIREVLNGL